MKIWKKVLNSLIPSRCVGCGDVLYDDQRICSPCWGQIDFISEPFCQICHMPFAFDTQTEQICQHCHNEPPKFIKAHAPFAYGGLGVGLILRLKHSDHIHLSKLLAKWMVNCAGDSLEKCDVLVPVPIHWKRLVTRRYNQAAILCHDITKLTNIPTLSRALKRNTNTPPQGHMNKAKRNENVKNVIEIASDVKDLTVMLVDDVYTTGATINACTKVLLNHGAKSVYVLTAAKVRYD